MLVLLTILLAAVVVPGVFSGGLPATCYNVQGEAISSWLPCDSGATTSVCCGHNDFCLSNGLCLDAGADNYYSQQGCTDQNWGAPCAWYCPTMTGSYSRLWQCSNVNPHTYCCGDDASCCSGDASTMLSIDLFTAASHPGNTVATTVTTVTGTSTATRNIATTTHTATETTTTTSNVATTTVSATETATAAATVTANGDKSKGIQLGAGIGVAGGAIVFTGLGVAAGYFWGRRGAQRKAAARDRRRPAGRPAPLLGGPTAYVQPAYHEVDAQGVFPRQELET